MGERFDVWSPKIRNALGQFRRVSREALKDAAAYGEKRAQGYAPVKTGNLRSQIRGTTEGTGTGALVNRPRLFISAPRRYAPVEFGSRRGHRAQRFIERGMFDAIEFLERQILKDGADLLIRGSAGHIGPRFSGRRR